jgi:hypothetical protein
MELAGTRTDARGYVGATLLVALRAPVTRDAGYSVLTWALPRGLVAGFPRRADRVAVAC